MSAQGGAAIVPAVVSGQVDFGGVVVKAASPLKTAADLAGKRVALGKGLGKGNVDAPACARPAATAEPSYAVT